MQSKYNFETGEYETIPETGDWVQVAYVHSGSTWDWATIIVYYSPKARKFFWGSASGCSCTSFEDYFDSPEDYENGDKQDAINAVKRFQVDKYDKESRTRALQLIRDYKITKGIEK